MAVPPSSHDASSTGADRRRRFGRGRPGPLLLKEARRAAVDLLSRRAWTQAELTARLQRRGAARSVAEAVVAELVGRGYVDDAAFSRRWVEARAVRGYGATRLRTELRRRGVAADVIDAALAALTPESALERCREAARRRVSALQRGGSERAAPRLAAYLLRRGFPPGLVARVVRERFRDVPAGDD